MLQTIPQYSKNKRTSQRTVYNYIYAGLLRVTDEIGGIMFIDSETPFPVVHNGWKKGRPRKKKTDLDLLG